MKKVLSFLVLVLFVQISQAGNQSNIPGTILCEKGSEKVSVGYVGGSYSGNEFTIRLCGITENNKKVELKKFNFNDSRVAEASITFDQCLSLAARLKLEKISDGNYCIKDRTTGMFLKEECNDFENEMKKLSSFVIRMLY